MPYSSLVVSLENWVFHQCDTSWLTILFILIACLIETVVMLSEHKCSVDNFLFLPQAEAARNLAASQNVPSNFKDLIQNLVSI